MSKSNSYSRIGIDFADSSVKLLQLERADGAFSVSASARIDLPENTELLGEEYCDTIQKAIEAELSSGKFRGRKAVATIPADLADVRTVTILPGNGEETEKKLRWEAESYLSYNIDEAVIDHVVLGQARSDSESRTEVMVAAARKESVENLLAMTSRAGLALRAMEVVPCALGRLINNSTLGAQGHTALAMVDIGLSSSTVIILHKGDIRITRQIPHGGSQLTRLIAAGLEMNLRDAEALKRAHGMGLRYDDSVIPLDDGSLGAAPGPSAQAGTTVIPEQRIGEVIRDLVRPAGDQFAEEIQKLLRYFAMQSDGDSVARMVLSGGGGYLKHLDLFLQEQLELPVATMETVSSFLGGQATAEDSAAFAVAAGLALRDFSQSTPR